MFDVPNENLIEKEKGENREEKKARLAEEKKSRNQGRIRNEIEDWNPFEDEKVASDPEKTLIVGRLSYKTSEKTLSYEFEVSLSKTAEVRDNQVGQNRAGSIR